MVCLTPHSILAWSQEESIGLKHMTFERVWVGGGPCCQLECCLGRRGPSRLGFFQPTNTYLAPSVFPTLQYIQAARRNSSLHHMWTELPLSAGPGANRDKAEMETAPCSLRAGDPGVGGGVCAQTVKTVLGVGRAKSGLCPGNGRGKEADFCAPAAPTWVGLGRMAEREKRGFVSRMQGDCPGWGGGGLRGQSQCCSVWGGAGGRDGVACKGRTNLGEGQA